jgi:hypothetical protein
MKLKEAVDQSQGRKIKREGWPKDSWVIVSDGKLIWEDLMQDTRLSLTDALADDWIVHEGSLEITLTLKKLFAALEFADSKSINFREKIARNLGFYTDEK